MAKVAFADDDIDRRLPGGGGGVALADSGVDGEVVGGGEPLEICLGKINHFVSDVGTVDAVAHEGGFLEDDAGAAEGVEQTKAVVVFAYATTYLFIRGNIYSGGKLRGSVREAVS